MSQLQQQSISEMSRRIVHNRCSWKPQEQKTDVFIAGSVSGMLPSLMLFTELNVRPVARTFSTKTFGRACRRRDCGRTWMIEVDSKEWSTENIFAKPKKLSRIWEQLQINLYLQYPIARPRKSKLTELVLILAVVASVKL